MSKWMNRKDVCQRCFSGIDDDGDGNCSTCARMGDKQAAWMKEARVKLEEIETRAMAESLIRVADNLFS